MCGNKLLISLLTILTPLFVSCVPESGSETPLSTVSFKEIASGDYTISGVPENKKIEVYTSQSLFNSSLYQFLQPLTEYTVDFTSKKVVLVSLGQSSSAGYAISAEKIEDYGDYIKLNVIITTPGENCVTASVITSPYQFIEIDSTKRIIFNERIEVVDCV